MTSAFHQITKKDLFQEHIKGVDETPEGGLLENKRLNNYQAESETEDEEVKISCMGGLRGIDDSDLNSTFSSDEEESDDESECGNKSERGSPLTFISNHRYSKTMPVRPRFTCMPGCLSLALEGSEEDSEGASVGKRSVGARGVPVALDTDEESVSTDFSSSPEEKMDSTMHDADRWDFDGSSSESDEESTDGEGDDASCESSEQEDEENSLSSPEVDHEIISIASSLVEEDDSQLEEDADVTADIVIGVSQDEICSVDMPKTKRVMSFSNLSSPEDSSCCSVEVPFKRRKNSPISESGLPFLPFCLGEPEVEQDPLSSGSLLPSVVTNLCSSDEDEDEELDGQLREELNCSQSEGGDKSPVPLLTPPTSPVPVAGDCGYHGIVCEWPSNLTIDSAMTALLSDIRPLSPVSLVQSECDDFEFSKAMYDNTTLTPLLRGMVVRQF